MQEKCTFAANFSDMQKVNSFIIDHKKLVPGIYECAVNGIFTYDIRFVRPQDAAHKGLFMDPKVAHTLEHFMAHYLRTMTSEEFSSTVLYVGPMGCLTGFYLLTSKSYGTEFLRKMMLECMEYILGEEVIPGATELTCGNWEYFNLQEAKSFIKEVIVPNFTSEEFCSQYPYCQE